MRTRMAIAAVLGICASPLPVLAAAASADITTEVVVLLTRAKERAPINLGDALDLADRANDLCDRDRRADRSQPGIVGALCAGAYEQHALLKARWKRLKQLHEDARAHERAKRFHAALERLEPLPSDAPSNDPALPLRAMVLRLQDRVKAASADAARPNEWRAPRFPWRRVHLGVSQVGSVAALPFTESRGFVLYDQPLTIDASYKFLRPRLGKFDVSGWVRLWDKLAIGGAYSEALAFGDVDGLAQIPNPNPALGARAVDFELTKTHRAERSIHGGIGVAFDGVHGSLAIFVGPSLVHLALETISAVEVEEFAGNRIAVVPHTTETSSKSRLGANVAVDGSWMFADVVGVGGFIRYTQAEVALANGRSQEVFTYGGGITTGWGVRFRF
jgi:hypothetical protein